MNEHPNIPLLSTGDMLGLTGTTRRRLDEYTAKGIVKPFRSSAGKGNKQWTLRQAALVNHVPDLLDAGLSLEDTATLLEGGHDETAMLLMDHIAERARRSRRTLLALAQHLRELDDISAVLGNTGLYLRYIPQRYAAIAPALESSELPGERENIRLRAQTLHTAEIVGWAPTDSTGTFACYGKNGSVVAHYVYAALAVQPMPRIRPDDGPDVGCYRFLTDTDAEGCEKCSRCSLCPWRGRRATQTTIFAWRAREAEHPELSDMAPLIGALERPYPAGPWREFTTKNAGTDEADPESSALGAAAIPRLMPLESRLPLGMTAGVLPSGFYLCKQWDAAKQREAIDHMNHIAAALPQVEVSDKQEATSSRHLTALYSNASPSMKSEQGEMALIDRPVGLPSMKGWTKNVGFAELSQIAVPVNAAFAPADGYLIACAEMPPIDRDDMPIYESQLLVCGLKGDPPPEHFRR